MREPKKLREISDESAHASGIEPEVAWRFLDGFVSYTEKMAWDGHDPTWPMARFVKVKPRNAKKGKTGKGFLKNTFKI